MKAIAAFLFCITSVFAFAALPDGVTLGIELKDAVNNSLTITPKDTPNVILRFTNNTDKEKAVRVYLYHPFHRRLPFPAWCSVRFVNEKGEIHPHAKWNGEWWNQYICWSIFIWDGEKDEPEKNTRIIPVRKYIEIEAPLHEILRVPAGGEPNGWMWNHKNGYLLGKWRFQIRFEDIVSREFLLNVVQEKQKKAKIPESAFCRFSHLTAHRTLLNS